ncbi:hypothetical protein K9M47_04745 [Candidatus Gracilibacteria bacterium]|nr:hypothetical protein [Candidatus Gracilibacteria bacterium]
MDEEHKERLKRWKEKANEIQHDHWVRFVIFWMIFDAYMTEESGEDSVEGRLRWFINNDNDLKTVFWTHWSAPEYIKVLETLKSHSPLRDMRPQHRHEATIPFNDIKNENELFRFMYQIRCNTFHGGKDLFDQDDNELTRCVEILFDKPIGVYLET